MRISYPSAEDARRGLKDGHISYNDYLSIINAVRNGSMPPQTTKLGGSIRIHGGGNSADWTLGCIGMDDTDIKELFGLVRRGTRVEIFRSSRHETTVSEALHLNQTILAGAQNQLKHPALYTHSASTVIRLNYPMGDIPGDQAVCTDIVIRALRHAGLDLQALIHEDALMNPDRYAPDITSPDYHIDHRRTRNLYRLLSERAIRLDSTPDNARPGDIVIMDTGIPNGTIYDHIGIIDNTRDSNGSYNVINIWTTGCKTESFSLLGHAYPDIVGLFRLTHPFDY